MVGERTALLRREDVVVVALLAVCIGVGAALRLGAVDDRLPPNRHAPGDVERYYVGTAESYLAGTGWVSRYRQNFIPPPLQAGFIVLVRKLVPDASYGALRTVQAWIGTATIVLAFWIGAQLGGRWAGVAAAVLFALDPAVVGLVGVLLAETNYLFLLFAFLGTLIAATRRCSATLAGASGLLLGLTSLTKPFPVLLVALVPAWWIGRRRDRRSVAMAVALAAAFSLPVLPWVARNYDRYGRILPISTNGGTALAMGNYLALDSSRTVYWEEIQHRGAWKSPEIEARFSGRRDRYGKLDWNGRDAAYARHALAYIRDHPGHFLRNYAIKLYNVFRYPLAATGKPLRARHYFRMAVLLTGLAGAAWFAATRWAQPEFILIPILGYFAAMTALFHISRSGRINLPVKLLVGFFASWMLTRAAGVAQRAIRNRRQPDPDGRARR